MEGWTVPGLPIAVATLLLLAAALTATAHVLLHKEEPRAAVGWIALVWLSPLVGGLLYVLLGINRVQRHARRLRPTRLLPTTAVHRVSDVDLGGLESLAWAMGQVTGRPLTHGNEVRLLDTGDVAYPEMLAAIDAAERSVGLCMYIFDRDEVGRQFVDALSRAVARGVEVRVLVDALGLRYSLPSVLPLLRRSGVRAARFLPARPWSVAFLNLRNHRKILVVDGHIGFTGGMNLRAGPTRDLMARVSGPAVGQLVEALATDWSWTTGEELSGPAWFPELESTGTAHARIVPDGPDSDMDKARLAFVSALACARHSVRIVTPYFLPEESLLTALDAAVLRGVEVDVLIPEVSNLPYVTWATRADLPRLLGRGARVWWVPPPFDHTKLMVVDRQWVLLGSANWDARSLRLNFELQLEVYDPALGAEAEDACLARREVARAASAVELESAGLLLRLRDALARLAKPYL